MKTNKKGFTITELVIVIVVIAILAAVLIPTFVGLINKANISADTQLAKNLNTALVMDEAANGKPESFSEALDALREGGFLLANMNPTADGCYLAWESETNQILLVELKDNNYKVLFNAKEGYKDPGETWYFAVKDQATADAIEAVLGDSVNYELTILDTTALNNEINAEGDNTVYIDGSITTDDNNTIVLNNPNANTTIDLGNSTVSGGSTNAALYAIPFHVEAGKLTLVNGVVDSTGRGIDEDGDTVDVPLQVGKNGYAKIEGTTFNINTDNEGYLGFNGDADLVDVTVNSTDCGVLLNGNTHVALDNTTIKAKYCFFLSGFLGTGDYSGDVKLTINSGEYTSEWACVQINNGGVVEINGGTFHRENTTTGSVLLFQLESTTNKIIINGGTFIQGETVYEYEDLTAEIIKKLVLIEGKPHEVAVSGSTATGWVITPN